MGLLETQKTDLETRLIEINERMQILDNEIREKQTEYSNLRSEKIKIETNLDFMKDKLLMEE
jgi:hypothetical protein